MLRLAFDFIITWRETRTRPNAYEIVKKKYRKRPNIQSLYDFEQPIKHDKV